MAVFTSRSRFGSFPIVILFGYASPSSLSLPETVVGPPSIRPVLILNAPGIISGTATGQVGTSPSPEGELFEALFGSADVITPIVSVGFEEVPAFGDPYFRLDLTAQSAAVCGNVSLAVPEGLAQTIELGEPPVGEFFVAGNLAEEVLFGSPIVRIETGPPIAIDSKFGTVPVVSPRLDVAVRATFGQMTITLGKPSFFSLRYPIPPGRRQPTYLLEVLDKARLPAWKSRLHHIYARSLPPQRWPFRCPIVK